MEKEIEIAPEAFADDLKLSLRSSVRMTRWLENGNPIFRFEDPVCGKFFHAGKREAMFLQALASETSLGEVIDKCHVEPDFANALLVKVAQAGLLDGVAAEKFLLQKTKAARKVKRLTGWNPLSFRIPLLCPDKFLDVIKPLGNVIFSRWCVFLWLVVVAWGVIAFCSFQSEILVSIREVIAPNNWLGLIAIWLVLKAVHELAHGLAAKHFGVQVREAGVLMLLFTPLAYVDVSDIWRIRSKRQRMIVVAAGMYVEVFLAFVALGCWSLFGPGTLGTLCLHAFFLGTATTILFNANPLMRFDGYYLLTDSLGVQNLYRKGSQWWSQTWQSLVFGFVPCETICQPEEKRVVSIYGFLAFLWRIAIALSLTFGATLLFPDWGLILGTIGVFCWMIVPVSLAIVKVYRSRQQIRASRLLATVFFFLIFGAATFFVFSAPAKLSAPALVQFRGESHVRAPAAGFISKIFVAEDQLVREGAALFELDSRQLAFDLKKIELDIEEAEINIRVHRNNGNHELAATEIERRQMMHQRRVEIENNLSGLVVRAQQSGVVVSDGLAEKEGTFAKQGDLLMTIVDPTKKQILVSVDQSEEESLSQMGEGKITLLFANRSAMSAKLVKVEPVATTIPTHAELTSINGGSIAVRQVSESEETESVLFLSPRISMELQVSAEDEHSLMAGERGCALIPAKSQSLGSYMYLQLKNWFRAKLSLRDKVSEG